MNFKNTCIIKKNLDYFKLKLPYYTHKVLTKN